ncbi:MAG: hypothetical protein B5766_01205 [Candidatus Lumbricidophila eiseniae]|uniref:Uncharacterized protein n=1 Tax=Candidatus Lumbricidiphila eiseniae TaxID=1969409 RepID=A0A2A6FTX6_9MICO|nr:MAG: hypothetical protein B5766_01205 [Candidatus Lumbricidophila eiseniae]
MDQRTPRLPQSLRVRVAAAAIGSLVAVTVAVVLAQWLRRIPAIHVFIAAYPGVIGHDQGTPIGTPPWLAWQHFLNTLFLVLIVRTGLQLHSKKRPPSFWTRDNTRWPRTARPPRRLSIYLWCHLWVDALWIMNGIIYIVLLVITGQWRVLVPTDWSVVPHAVSVALQYASLDWPLENAWVGYNALQQILYTTVVFIAAPLAILTGLRLSPAWPTGGWLARPLSERMARAIHYPVLLFFIGFTIVHVGLVLTTGMFRNLNQMYAARESADAVGFIVCAIAVAVLAVAWVVTKPGLLKRIAATTGKVQG